MLHSGASTAAAVLHGAAARCFDLAARAAISRSPVLARRVLWQVRMNAAQEAAQIIPITPDRSSLPARREPGASDDGSTDLDAGWRRGRPLEDPAKTKRWGVITAKPSEYLIHVRRGRIRRKSTGQGASCFKWPWDSVAVIPTTINRLQFTADQVTREKVGVQVTGLAVYRIVEPEIAFRMLNFSYAERASQKLAEILREMFVGATRRHVANLTVEDVMTRRKEAIGGELMRELAPVMRGHGQAEDATSTGWGVVLDTVEVQNVHILSEAVFRDMQAEFRSTLTMRARQAELISAQETATREASSTRAIEEARLTAASATRELRAKAESQATEIEIAETSRRESLESRAAEARLARHKAHEIAALRADAEVAHERAAEDERARLAALAREQTLAEAERQAIEARHQNALREAELEAEMGMTLATAHGALREVETAAQAVIRRRDLELEQRAGEVQAAVAQAMKEVDNLISEDRIRMTLVERSLPAMAEAFGQQLAEVRLTHIGGEGADPAAMVGRSIAQILELARGLGLRVGRTTEDA